MAQPKYEQKRQRKSYNCHGECTAKSKISDTITDMFAMADYETDPYGSYTGIPINPKETPVQDADDL